MNGYQYSTPFNGTLQALPYDYLRHATDPGRNIAAGMESLGKNLGDGIGAFLARKDQNAFVDQHLQDLLGEVHSETTSGNIMDRKTPESKLLAGVMHMTKTDSPDSLMEFVGKVPSMPLEKKKALASDLQFMLDRHDKNKMQDAELAYKSAITDNILTEMANRKAAAQSQMDILSQPTERQLMGSEAVYKNAFLPDIQGLVELPKREIGPAQYWMNKAKMAAPDMLTEALNAKKEYDQTITKYSTAKPGPEGLGGVIATPMSMLDPGNRTANLIQANIDAANHITNAPAINVNAMGSIPVQGPSREQIGTKPVVTGKEPIPYYEQFVNAAKSMASRGIPVDVNSVNAILASKGSMPPMPDGMTPMSTSQTVGNTTVTSQNIPVMMAEVQAKMAPQLMAKVVDLHPLVGGGTAMARSDEDAKDLRKVGKQMSDGIYALDTLENIMKDPKHWAEPTVRAQVDPLYNQLKSALRSGWIGPGSVSDQEQKLLTQAIRNPNTVFSLDRSTHANFEIIRKIMTRGYKNQLESNGIKVGESSGTQNVKSYIGDTRLK